MNDDDLRDALQSIRTPERGEEDWDAFTAQVMRRARHASARPVATYGWWKALALGTGVAMASLAFGYCIGTAHRPAILAVLQRERAARADIESVPAMYSAMLQSGHNCHELATERQ